MDGVYDGTPVHIDDISLMIDRQGVLEDANFSFSYNPAFDATGQVRGLFVVCTETTAQIHSQRALAKSDKRLHMALSAGNSIGTWDWNVADDYVTADARFADLYGVDPQQAETGAPIAQFLANVNPDDVSRVRREIAEALRTGEAFTSEYRLMQPDGSVRWVTAQGQATLDGAGQAVHFPGVTFDITARKNAEAQQAILSGELQHRNKNLMAQALCGK
ncbi:PAS domain-containing protein [Loktanella sp. DJP18]|uniref:PAS domain-containing protein n=1 Tax=Loktanella sp. DJP18 TaxID=3409788 RepID=UPI003BB7CF06